MIMWTLLSAWGPLLLISLLGASPPALAGCPSPCPPCKLLSSGPYVGNYSLVDEASPHCTNNACKYVNVDPSAVWYGQEMCMCDPGPYEYTNCQEIKCGVRRTGENCINGNRIMGGEDTECNEWPWQAYVYAAIDQDSGSACGGSLINDRFVVTAAHCVIEYVIKPENITVWLGRHSRAWTTGKKEFRADAVIIHEMYDSSSQENDIAVIKLSEKVDLETYTPVCMPKVGIASAEDLEGKNMSATGWGRTSYDGARPENLQEIVETVPIVSKKECLENSGVYSINAGSYAGGLYINQGDLKEGMFCGGVPANDEATCKGDSGGPLIHQFETNRYRLVGVTSWSPKDWDSSGNRETCTRSYNIYNDVPYYRGWITEKAGYVYLA